MSQNVVPNEQENNLDLEWTEDKKNLLKNTKCKRLNQSQFDLFLYSCQRLKLDPFMNQIHAVERPFYDTETKKWRKDVTTQTGIDGYRIIAERTGKYSPGKATAYTYDEKNNLISAIAYVKKMTNDGSWHEISAEAFYEEYVAKKKDGTPNSMWNTKPHIMLGKCAEALALRKAFPADLSGLYTYEEMEQSQSTEIVEPMKINHKISEDQLKEIRLYTDKLPIEKLDAFLDFFKISKIHDLESDDFDKAVKKLKATVKTIEGNDE